MLSVIKNVRTRVMIVNFFFKQKTAYEMRISDWSSDVCSSDLFKRQRGKLCTSRCVFRWAWVCGGRFGRANLRLDCQHLPHERGRLLAYHALVCGRDA